MLSTSSTSSRPLSDQNAIDLNPPSPKRRKVAMAPMATQDISIEPATLAGPPPVSKRYGGRIIVSIAAEMTPLKIHRSINYANC